MEEVKYTQYVKTDENGSIIDAKSSAFVTDPENWEAAGQRTERHWHFNLRNNYSIPLYKLVEGEIYARDDNEVDSESVVNAKVMKINEIKALANHLILAEYPYWKQNNIQTRAIDLVDIKSGRQLTNEEQTEYDAIQVIKDWIYSIREQSDTFEAAVNNLTDLEEVVNYEIVFTT